MDRATAAYEPSTAAEWEAHTRGEMRGEWLVVWQLRELDARGETNLRSALAHVEAAMLARKCRRSPRDFRAAMRRHGGGSRGGLA